MYAKGQAVKQFVYLHSKDASYVSLLRYSQSPCSNTGSQMPKDVSSVTGIFNLKEYDSVYVEIVIVPNFKINENETYIKLYKLSQ